VAIDLRVVQFWSEIILVISNQTRAVRSFDFEITRMISDQIALHSVQLPLLSYYSAVLDLRQAQTLNGFRIGCRHHFSSLQNSILFFIVHGIHVKQSYVSID